MVGQGVTYRTKSLVQEEGLLSPRSGFHLYHMSLIGIYLREGVIYSILRTIVPGPEPPLGNKLLGMFGVNHGAERLWPLPWPVTLVHPNKAH
jgi:hypothetical protein